MNLFQKIKLFKIYKKSLKNNLDSIKKVFINNRELPYIIKDIRYDRLFKIYTVINFKKDTQNTIKEYGYYYMDDQIKSFIKEFDKELKNIGISEFVKLTNAEQLSKESILIEIEFKFLNLKKIAKLIISLLLILIISLILLIFKTI